MKSSTQTIFGIDRGILSFGILSKIEGYKTVYTKLLDFHPCYFSIDENGLKWYFLNDEICSYKNGIRSLYNDKQFKI